MSPLIFRGVRGNFSFFDDIHISKQNNPKLRFAASHLGLFCLPMSHKKDTRFVWKSILQDHELLFIYASYSRQFQFALKLMYFICTLSISGKIDFTKIDFTMHVIFLICKLSLSAFSSPEPKAHKVNL